MASAAALPDESAPAKSGPSLVVQIGVLVAMTVVAVGLGFVSGNFIKGSEPQAAAPAKASADHGASGGHGEATPGEDKEEHDPLASPLPNVVLLPSITTNLASPSDIWVRMELSIIFADAPDPEMTETIHQDLLAFMRTVKLHQVEGASGFQHLKSDLEDRVRIRSAGKVKGVLFRTLLYE